MWHVIAWLDLFRPITLFSAVNVGKIDTPGCTVRDLKVKGYAKPDGKCRLWEIQDFL